MKMADPVCGRCGLERFGDRGSGGANGIAIECAGREGLVEEREKLFASFMVMFPRVFPVQHNRDGDLFLRRVVHDLAQPAKDIFGRHFRGGFVVDEPKGIGDLPIAKQHRDVLVFWSDLVRLIEIPVALPGLLGCSERASEDAFIGRQPPQSDLRQHRNQFRTDGAFRWPEAHGRPAECGGVKFDGALQLCFRIVRCMESRGEREIRSGASGKIGIDDERQDRMKEGGRRQLDLFPLHQSSIERNDVLHGHELEGQYFLFFFFREASVFLAQRSQAGITTDGTVAEPGEIVPCLQIQEVLGGELSRNPFQVMTIDVGSSLHEQFMIARVWAHHRRPIGGEKMPDKKGFLFWAKIRCRALRMLQKEVAHRS